MPPPIMAIFFMLLLSFEQLYCNTKKPPLDRDDWEITC